MPIFMIKTKHVGDFVIEKKGCNSKGKMITIHKILGWAMWLRIQLVNFGMPQVWTLPYYTYCLNCMDTKKDPNSDPIDQRCSHCSSNVNTRLTETDWLRLLKWYPPIDNLVLSYGREALSSSSMDARRSKLLPLSHWRMIVLDPLHIILYHIISYYIISP